MGSATKRGNERQGGQGRLEREGGEDADEIKKHYPSIRCTKSIMLFGVFFLSMHALIWVFFFFCLG